MFRLIRRTPIATSVPHVVIVGGGFGGLYAARALKHAPVRVTILDRRNHHLFQPLLYQVAGAALNPSDVAFPIRKKFRSQSNVSVIMGEAQSIDTSTSRIIFDRGTLDYDYLILATGTSHTYFGHHDWEHIAPGLKTIEPLTPILVRVFTAQLQNRDSLPENWRSCLFLPLLKPNKPPSELGSYRPVAITSILCRVFEHVVLARLRPLVPLHDRQFGFRPTRRVEMLLSSLLGSALDGFSHSARLPRDSLRGRDPGSLQPITYVMMIDLCDAFCRVPLEQLLGAASLLRFPAYLLRWISEWLTCRTASTFLAGVHTASVSLASGLPQGSVLGPFLFAVFIDSLACLLADKCRSATAGRGAYRCSHCHSVPDATANFGLYADDITIWVTSPVPCSLQRVSSALLAVVAAWCSDHQMLVSSKSQVLVLTRSNRRMAMSFPPLTLAGLQLVPRAECARLLGYVLDPQLHFTRHAELLITQMAAADRRLRFIAPFVHPCFLRSLWASVVGTSLRGAYLWRSQLSLWRVLLAYEAAETESDPKVRDELLTFVVIGGGPTGVELAGSLAEISRHSLAKDFRRIVPESARVILVEGGPRILQAFPEELSAKAVKQLQGLGVEVETNAAVTSLDETGITIRDGKSIKSRTVLWAAGVQASPLGATLNVPSDRAGRIFVDKTLRPPGLSKVFVIGDLAAATSKGAAVPGIAPAAIQGGKYAANAIVRLMQKRDLQAFTYFDKGILATIGRSAAVAKIGPLELSGFLAWIAWCVIHVMFLIGFRNRVFVMLEWFWSYMTFQRGARLITGVTKKMHPPTF